MDLKRQSPLSGALKVLTTGRRGGMLEVRATAGVSLNHPPVKMQTRTKTVRILPSDLPNSPPGGAIAVGLHGLPLRKHRPCGQLCMRAAQRSGSDWSKRLQRDPGDGPRQSASEYRHLVTLVYPSWSKGWMGGDRPYGSRLESYWGEQ